MLKKPLQEKKPVKKPPQQRLPPKKEETKETKEKETKPKESDVFEPSRRDRKMVNKPAGVGTEKHTRPKPKKEAGLYEETAKIKQGGLRSSLKVPTTYKFTVRALTPLLKVDIGKKFSFLEKEFTMTERMKKQIQLAITMLKN
tara:strand:+ start:896 stop:1324 length:429 start_codon:yes stop_codon:yes gene_type:complete